MPRHEQHVVERQGGREAYGDQVGVQDVGSGVHSVPHSSRSGTALRSMTLLVLLPASTGTGIVAADLRLVALDLPDDVVATRARGARRRPAARGAAGGAARPPPRGL